MINANNNTCFETPVTVKWLIVCSTEKQLCINNSSILLKSPGKKTSLRNPHPLGNCLLLVAPFPSEFPLPSVEGGGGGECILSGTTQWKSGQVEGTFWVYTLLRKIAKPASQFCWNLANLLSDSYSKRTASANFDFFFRFGDIVIFSTGNANDLLSLTSSVCL